MKTVLFVRGIPGSGKTTYAKYLARQLKCEYFEADQFLVDDEGNYSYDKSKLQEAHDACIQAGIDYLQENTHVIYSNTFVKNFDFEKYLQQLHETFGKFEAQFYVTNYAGQSIHGVPGHVIDRMKLNFASNQELIAYFKTKYDLRYFDCFTR